ncbi:hypothetical protein [Xenorhabdus eapokensis]|uniref:Uncharacterized protein n=1 Tax=Xenorhabdus eapokensis TaxID=1873482 RepID=A0A1Q5TIT1_9GAMM|nr:hypothetical protein [Xenorhabdus eapokensis]OKP00119.1 hypothetical protein Xedl_03438 [Xenorhabdus eapokensis]OKP00123.1 hypothetical protein Xedl_03442 [Xenorhabdus eapokensis]
MVNDHREVISTSETNQNYLSFLMLELPPILAKHIEQGRAIRQGQSVIPFNEEELALIQTKYGVNAVELISLVNRPCEKWHRAIFDLTGKEISK